MAQQWWEAAPVVKQAPRADQRGAVEYAAPVEPMSPAEAERLQLAKNAEARAAANDMRAIARDEYQMSKPTQEQGQAGFLVARIKGGIEDINGILQKSPEAQQPGLAEAARGGLSPEGFGGLITRQLAEPERRAVADAQSDMLDAVLTLATGAAYTKEQLQGMSGSYFPQYGDTPEEIDIKNRRLLRAVEAAKLRAGPLAPQLDDVANMFRQQAAPATQPEAIVTAPGTTRAAAMGAVTPGEPVMTDQDMAAGRAIQEAWNATGKFEDVARVAAQFGRTFGEQEAAFLKANEGKPVNINANPTGTPTATQEAVGEFVSIPGGEMLAAGAVEGANTFTLGTLDELAPVLGLDPQRVQMAKDFLRQRNPVSSMAGGVGAGIVGAGMGVPAALGRAGLNVAPLVTDAALGAAFGAGDQPAGSDLTDRLGGAALGAGLGAAGGAAGRRLFGGGASGAGGDGMPPSGPMGGAGGTMGGATAASGGRSSVSAAATPDDLIRASKAAELGIDLMPFQASRSFKDMQRAHELAKNGEIGGPLRERFGRQQAAVMQKFDDFIEGTGSQVRENLAGQGAKLTGALEKMAANDKAKVRTLYKQAEKSADAATPVPLDETVNVTIGGDDVDTTLIEWLNSQPTGLTTSGITDSAKQLAARLGIAKIDPNTRDLVPAKATVKGMETLRREVSQIADGGDPNLIRQKTVLKNLIDGHTEPHATGAYAKARAARRDVAVKYEEVSTIAQLLGTKRNTPERLIAAENVMERLIKGNTSVANIKALRKLTTGEGGDPQAWKEVQGATLEYLRGKAYGAGNNKDEFGNPVIQVASFRNAVADLDKSGKLDELLGFEKANAVRVMADTAQDMFTAPSGSVNFSNTNSMWWGIADMLLNGALFQIPLPAGVVSNVLAPLKRTMKEAPLKKEVKQLIGEPTQ